MFVKIDGIRINADKVSTYGLNERRGEVYITIEGEDTFPWMSTNKMSKPFDFAEKKLKELDKLFGVSNVPRTITK